MGTQALSLTVVVGSPLSALTLYLYARSIKKNGALFTQRVSNVLCIIGLSLILLVSQRLNTTLGQTSVILFYTFREIYVSLLSAQQWSFIGSILDKSTSSYIVTFAGIVSTASALGGCFVEVLVSYGGVTSLLAMSLFSCVFSYIWVETAYFLRDNDHNNINISKNSEINNTQQNDDTINDKEKKTITPKQEIIKKGYFSSGITRDFINIMFKYRTLQLLFIEAIVHQCSANMLNLMFHDGLRMGITEASYRAVIVGRFFATVNLTACLLQCFVLPRILSPTSLPYVLIMVPMTLLLISLFSCFNPNLLATMFAFGTLKVMEYSIMTASTELIYMPMGQEVRYLGKEMIRFFGHRLGKSAASLLLSYMIGHFKPTLGVQLIWSTILTGCWGVAMSFLATHLVDREKQTVEGNIITSQQQTTPIRRASKTGTESNHNTPSRRPSNNIEKSTENTPTRSTGVEIDNSTIPIRKSRDEGTWRTCFDDSPKATRKGTTWRTSSNDNKPSFEPSSLGLRNRKHSNINIENNTSLIENENNKENKDDDIWRERGSFDEADDNFHDDCSSSDEGLTDSIESGDMEGIEVDMDSLQLNEDCSQANVHHSSSVQVLGPSTISTVPSSDWINGSMSSDDDGTDASQSPFIPIFNKSKNQDTNNNIASMVVRVGSTFFKFQNK